MEEDVFKGGLMTRFRYKSIDELQEEFGDNMIRYRYVVAVGRCMAHKFRLGDLVNEIDPGMSKEWDEIFLKEVD
jgi:hypothetical protein